MFGSVSTRSRLLTWCPAPFVAALLLLAAPTLAQNAPASTGTSPTGTGAGRIAGTVRDGEGEALPGANVLVTGTALGAATDLDGRFVIEGLQAGTYALRVSYIGFAERIVEGVVVRAGETTTVDVSMTGSDLQGDEVVVVGYGVQRRADVAGTVASVGAEEIEQTTTNNIGQALQGRVPGLSVSANAGGAEGNDLALVIRGRSSITASDRPLIILDGIPYNGSLSDINSQDVASIDILRDASAAAIYGSRGANGVLLITTKGGGEGRPRVNYELNVGSSEAVEVPNLMNGAQFAAFKCQRLANTRQITVATTPDCPDNPTIEDLTPYLTQTELDGVATGRSIDWLDLAMRTGFRQEHNLSFTGGGNGTSYYLGGSLLSNEGVAEGDKFNRYSLRLNVGQRAFGWLEIGSNTQLSSSDRGGVSASFENAFFFNPLANAFEADGALDITPWAEDVLENPLEGLYAVSDDRSNRVFTSNFVQASAPFLKGLSYRLNAGLEVESRKQGSYYGRDTQRGLSLLGDGRTASIFGTDWTLENVVRFQRAFGVHNVDLTTLYSAQSSQTENNAIDFQGLPNDVRTYYQADVAALVLPNNTYSKANLVSQMARLNYGFDSRYVATLTVRRDGYSGFGANYKYGIFPSAALAWNVDREPFFPRNRYVERFKVRASYGENGNQAISPYQTLARLSERSYVDGETTLPGFIPATLSNPNLKWERTRSASFGADFVFLRGRLEGSADAYFNRTDDLLLARAISAVNGITSITQNIGATSNRGFELQLTAIALETRGFRWSMDFNLATNSNRITALYGGDITRDIGNGWFIGSPIDVNYAYRFAGIFQAADPVCKAGTGELPEARNARCLAEGTAFHTANTRPGDVRVQDTSGDGQINADDRTFVGSLEPDYIAGFGTTLRYKNVSFNVFLNSVQGVQRQNLLRASNQVFADVRRNIPVLEYWSEANPINTYPENRDGANPFSVGFYEDASFVRLRDVSLSYALPKALLRRLGGIQTFRLQAAGHNLYTWTDWTGLDPEINSQRAIPLERTYTLGLDFSF